MGQIHPGVWSPVRSIGYETPLDGRLKDKNGLHFFNTKRGHRSAVVRTTFNFWLSLCNDEKFELTNFACKNEAR